VINKKLTIIILLFVCYTELIAIELPNPKPLQRILEFTAERGDNQEKMRTNRINAIKQSELLKHELYGKAPELMSSQPEWSCIGPFNVSGRIRSIALHPTKPGHIYVGAAAGGIWRTTDNGNNWVPLFDFENSISFGSIAIDPVEPDIIYAATGEMIIGGGIPYLGAGIYHSTDAGKTWGILALTEVGAFSKIYVHPLDRNLIVAGGTTSYAGLYISRDRGKTWQRNFSGNITDISLNRNNINEMFIAVNGDGVYHTENLGATWSKTSSGISNIGGRISVQAAQSNFSIVYALVERNNSRAAIFKSTNRGASWQMVHDGDFAFFRGQGFYNNFLAVHPTNSAIVFAGGIDLWRTDNGGNSWVNVSVNVQNGRMHVDNHHAVFSTIDPRHVYNATDGGIYHSSNTGVLWRDINSNLAITQFYSISLDLQKPYVLFGGTQDNGTVGNRSNEWSKLVSGDGFDLFLHPDDNTVLFGELYYGQIFRYKFNSGGRDDLQFIYDRIPAQDSGVWHSPFILDKKHRRMFLGLHGIYVSYDFGENFFPLSPRRNHQHTTIAYSELDSRILFAGNRIGQLFRTTNSGKDWQEVNSPNMPRRYVRDIKMSRKSTATAYASFSGYGKPHLFKTTNLGESWFDIGGNLPDVPVNKIALHPNNEDIIFVATDIGVYATYDGGSVWFPYGRSMPRSPVVDLLIHDNTALFPQMKLRAATHGRSIWETDIVEMPTLAPEITSPAGGENYVGTTQAFISWASFKQPVDIFVRYSETEEWTELASNVYGNSFLWKLPDRDALIARILVRHGSDFRISNSFSIMKVTDGALLASGYVPIAAYGIAHDGDNSLWVTNYSGNSVHKINLEDFSVSKTLTLPYSEFYTDIALNDSKDIIYVQRLNNEAGTGGIIITLDTAGNVIREFPTPAVNYPVGLTWNNGQLFTSERDGQRRIFVIDALTGNVKSNFKNPFDNQYGPRCLAFHSGSLYQTSTLFVSNALNNAYALVFSPSNPSEVLSQIPLATPRNVINARGIDISPDDYNIWISDISGNIYKIANDKSLTSVANPITSGSLYIVPNPAGDYFTVSLFAENSGTYKFELIDLFGRIISIADRYSSGNQAIEITFRTHDFNSGIYSLRVSRDGSYFSTHRVAITR